MLELEAKRQLKASEGAHFFFALIFLIASGIVQNKFSNQNCSVNVKLFVDALFYGLLVWSTYLIILILPRYKNPAIRTLFIILDVVFGIFQTALLVYAYQLYFNKNYDCQEKAPVLDFILELYITVMSIIVGIILSGILSWLLRRLSKVQQIEYDQYVDEE